jgi:hypothetical protein
MSCYGWRLHHADASVTLVIGTSDSHAYARKHKSGFLSASRSTLRNLAQKPDLWLRLLQKPHLLRCEGHISGAEAVT